jgi:ribonuclease P protein component
MYSFTQSEIRSIMRDSRTIKRTSQLSIKRASRAKTHGRVLIVVSRKVGNAVTRNLIKRRLRHIVRELSLTSHNFDYVIFTKPPITDITFEQLQTIIKQAVCDSLPK